jgi:hypothetical protein
LRRRSRPEVYTSACRSCGKVILAHEPMEWCPRQPARDPYSGEIMRDADGLTVFDPGCEPVPDVAELVFQTPEAAERYHRAMARPREDSIPSSELYDQEADDEPNPAGGGLKPPRNRRTA